MRNKEAAKISVGVLDGESLSLESYQGEVQSERMLKKRKSRTQVDKNGQNLYDPDRLSVRTGSDSSGRLGLGHGMKTQKYDHRQEKKVSRK